MIEPGLEFPPEPALEPGRWLLTVVTILWTAPLAWWTGPGTLTGTLTGGDVHPEGGQWLGVGPVLPPGVVGEV